MHALVDEPVADGEDEAAEHADVQLVDVEGVVLGEREAVLRRLVELVELGQLLGVVGELLAQVGEQLLAGGDVVLVLELRILALVEAIDHRLMLANGIDGSSRHGHVGEVVHGVAAPPELEQELVELAAEVAALVALVERGEQFVTLLAREQLLERRAGHAVRLSAHRPAAASTERVWKPCSVRYDSVGSSGCTTLS